MNKMYHSILNNLRKMNIILRETELINIVNKNIKNVSEEELILKFNNMFNNEMNLIIS